MQTKDTQIKNFRARIQYFIIFILLLLTEIFIGLFVRDSFVRPYVGDMLVVVLIYAFLRIFIPYRFKNLIWYVFIFAAFVEMLQYFHIGSLLGLTNCRIAMVILGSTFDVKDVFCYFVGCVFVWSLEKGSLHR